MRRSTVGAGRGGSSLSCEVMLPRKEITLRGVGDDAPAFFERLGYSPVLLVPERVVVRPAQAVRHVPNREEKTGRCAHKAQNASSDRGEEREKFVRRFFFFDSLGPSRLVGFPKKRAYAYASKLALDGSYLQESLDVSYNLLSHTPVLSDLLPCAKSKWTRDQKENARKQHSSMNILVSYSKYKERQRSFVATLSRDNLPLFVIFFFSNFYSCLRASFWSKIPASVFFQFRGRGR